jgi:hypothetical protein
MVTIELYIFFITTTAVFIIPGLWPVCCVRRMGNIFRSTALHCNLHVCYSSVSAIQPHVPTLTQTTLYEAILECKLTQTHSAPTNATPGKINGSVLLYLPIHCTTKNIKCVSVQFMVSLLDVYDEKDKGNFKYRNISNQIFVMTRWFHSKTLHACIRAISCRFDPHPATGYIPLSTDQKLNSA